MSSSYILYGTIGHSCRRPGHVDPI
jgi:hypothetical protein